MIRGFAQGQPVSLVVMKGELPRLADVRVAAMNLLARREHSLVELKEKLDRKFASSPELVESALNTLRDEGLQSDERFAWAFVSMRQRQGKGSQLIRGELRERGIDAALIASCVDESDSLWYDLACDARRKRFGEALPDNPREQARQMRFLHGRGFATRHIQRALRYRGDYLDE